MSTKEKPHITESMKERYEEYSAYITTKKISVKEYYPGSFDEFSLYGVSFAWSFSLNGTPSLLGREFVGSDVMIESNGNVRRIKTSRNGIPQVELGRREVEFVFRRFGFIMEIEAEKEISRVNKENSE